MKAWVWNMGHEYNSIWTKPNTFLGWSDADYTHRELTDRELRAITILQIGKNVNGVSRMDGVGSLGSADGFGRCIQYFVQDEFK